MKKIILITAILFSVSLQGQGFNSIDNDKPIHFGGGALFGMVGYYFGWDMSNGDRLTAIKMGIAVGTGVNVLKELTDIPSTGFSVDDVLFGLAGSVASTFITDAIFQSEGSKKRREALRIEKEKKRIDSFYD